MARRNRAEWSAHPPGALHLLRSVQGAPARPGRISRRAAGHVLGGLAASSRARRRGARGRPGGIQPARRAQPARTARRHHSAREHRPADHGQAPEAARSWCAARSAPARCSGTSSCARPSPGCRLRASLAPAVASPRWTRSGGARQQSVRAVSVTGRWRGQSFTSGGSRSWSPPMSCRCSSTPTRPPASPRCRPAPRSTLPSLTSADGTWPSRRPTGPNVLPSLVFAGNPGL